MPKTPSSAFACKVLLRHDFQFVKQKGSHAKYRKDGTPSLTVIVPMGRKNLRLGTFHSIVLQAGLSEEDFLGKRAA
ncbi:type II toxin-antitoxin system HicA family toxin [Streptomyces sp. NBC_00620]|uniref:type II toxin-antitoxin system HicA family toxin n=1 Tax=Streptomyces sp. NBC_00620 TaxID=2903666 RepID=UPI0022572B0B|nr:type II toxin-antitoxin system HicA family toxin [Streptomyces sp. NBC_00620]MCX4976246.1 type II toxin-antitoxin system HicA family toxin [Streptomyces sp. NBC_00620]